MMKATVAIWTKRDGVRDLVGSRHAVPLLAAILARRAAVERFGRSFIRDRHWL